MEAAPSASSLSDSATSTKSWTPEAHSWILVPELPPVGGPMPFTGPEESDDALVGILPHSVLGEGSVSPLSEPSAATDETGSSDGASDAAADHAAAALLSEVEVNTNKEAALHDTPMPTPASSPNCLSESLLHEGESVAELAVSEILSAECPLPSASAARPSMAASDAWCAWRADATSCPASPQPPPSPPPPLPAEHHGACDDERRPLSAARRLGVLPFPPCTATTSATTGGAASPASSKRKRAADDESSDGEADDAPFDVDLWCGGPSSLGVYPWGRPLALVAVLLASHAAVLLLGVAIGRQQQAYAGHSAEPMLIRRFSSGPQGTHARLAWP